MSTIKVNTLEEATAGGATFYTSKAWVNFNGTGTVAIRADGNVSSITDNGTGDYTVNFTSATADANYSSFSDFSPSSSSTGENSRYADYATARTTSLARVQCLNFGDVFADQPIVTCGIVR